jgi:hypothetical protein
VSSRRCFLLHRVQRSRSRPKPPSSLGSKSCETVSARNLFVAELVVLSAASSA